MSEGGTGRRVIITGGARGIGLAVAENFAAAGARICLFDLDAAELARAKDAVSAINPATEVVAVAGSVASGADVDGTVGDVEAMWDGVDALINSAGLGGAWPSVEMEEEQWRRMIDVNLTGSFLFAQRCARPMLAAGSGSIVNLASIYGRAGAPGRAAYCASKAAIVGLTQSLAVEWASGGVRVNAVAPAYTRTKMVADMVDDGRVDIEKVTGRTPAARMIEPGEVADVCAFLCSDAASAVTGEVIGVDGGWNANGFY